jgi:hypothetical protein
MCNIISQFKRLGMVDVQRRATTCTDGQPQLVPTFKPSTTTVTDSVMWTLQSYEYNQYNQYNQCSQCSQSPQYERQKTPKQKWHWVKQLLF